MMKLNIRKGLPAHTFPRRKSMGGFTLIEMLMVVVIIGLIASIVIANLSTSRLKSRDAKRLADMAEIQTAIETYYDDCGFYPRCGVSGTGCNVSGGSDVCSNAGTGGTLLSLAVVPTYMRSIGNDPSNPTGINNGYGYYYTRTYRKTGLNTWVSGGGIDDYILATRLENSSNPVLSPIGWGNSFLNYLVGNQ